MRACVLYQLNSPLEIVSGIEMPVLKPGQMLVRVLYAGLCHSQLMEVRGQRGQDNYLPHLLGHEGSGEVVEIGSGVSRFRPGDKVVLGWIKTGGLDAGGSRYRHGDSVINAGAVTTFSDYAVVSENRCVKLPEGIPLDLGVLFGCAVPTGAGMVFNSLQAKAGETLMVLGLGGIGMSAFLAARSIAGLRVIVADVSEHKLALALSLGADAGIDVRQENLLERVRELTQGVGLDYCVEAAGRTSTIELAFQSVRRGGGRCLFASHPGFGESIRLDPYDLICGKRIDGSWGGDAQPEQDVPRYAELYRAGRLPLQHLLDRRYRLEDINAALDDLEHGRIVRALIDMSA